jgi:hypothetical protein
MADATAIVRTIARVVISEPVRDIESVNPADVVILARQNSDCRHRGPDIASRPSCDVFRMIFTHRGLDVP